MNPELMILTINVLERAKCLQDVRKCEIELNFLRDNMAKQGGPDPDRGYLGAGGGPGRIAERKSPVQISNEVFSSAMNKGKQASIRFEALFFFTTFEASFYTLDTIIIVNSLLMMEKNTVIS